MIHAAAVVAAVSFACHDEHSFFFNKQYYRCLARFKINRNAELRVENGRVRLLWRTIISLLPAINKSLKKKSHRGQNCQVWRCNDDFYGRSEICNRTIFIMITLRVCVKGYLGFVFFCVLLCCNYWSFNTFRLLFLTDTSSLSRLWWLDQKSCGWSCIVFSWSHSVTRLTPSELITEDPRKTPDSNSKLSCLMWNLAGSFHTKRKTVAGIVYLTQSAPLLTLPKTVL